jgi:hypothetical protein
MALNVGVPQRGGGLKWIVILITVILIFLLAFALILLRYYTMRETVISTKIILNETALNFIKNSSQNTLKKTIESMQSSFLSFASSSQSSQASSSAISFFMFNLNDQSAIVRNSERTTIITLPTTTTTTLNLDYTSYKIRIPTKFKYCNPLSYKNENGILIPPDVCIVVNESCCPACYYGIINSVKKRLSMGGRLEAINARNYAYYKEFYLKNCSGFGVVCRMASSPTGCDYTAACVGGVCKLVSRG